MPDATALYGFDVQQTILTARWFREKLRRLDRFVLSDLLQQTIHVVICVNVGSPAILMKDKLDGLGSS